MTIKVHQGSYLVNHAYSQYDAGSADLNLLGGYFTVNNDPCGGRQTSAPNTTLHGDGTNQTGFGLDVYGSSARIEGITMRDFGNGLSFSAKSGHLDIASTIMTANDAAVTGAVIFITHDGAEAVLENSLLYGNLSPATLQAGAGTSDSSSEVVLINNTIVNNAGVGVRASYSHTDKTDQVILGYNNIVWNNGGGIDVDVVGANNPPTFLYSDIGSWLGAISTEGTPFLHVDPQFADTGALPLPNFTLKNTSPLINAGEPSSQLVYDTIDLGGGTRVIGSAIDFGAYESNVDDEVAQYVYSTADGTAPGTLGAALVVANSNVNPTTIRFAISGGCPQLIELAMPLEDITTDVTIDGYSQPGAAWNTQSGGYDGTICVILRAKGMVDHALQTGIGGRLTVQGIEFEGFNTAAVRIAAGNQSQVLGNGFAAFAGAPANVNGVRIEGSATNAIVGAGSPSQRNVFDQATHAAIDIQNAGAGHNVFGNFFGFDFDGSPWVGTKNRYAIVIAGTANDVIKFNTIGGTVENAIAISGASASGNRIANNVIGRTPFEGAADGNGFGTCNPVCLSVPAVDIVSSAHDNFIGAVGGTGGGNVIANNFAQGVWVESTAGSGNRIYGNNLIYDNGGNLPIDLGAYGSTLNDVTDGDGGPNNLQNYPTLSQAMRIEPGIIRLSGSLVARTGVAAQYYRIDVYWTDTCLYSGGGSDTPRGDMKKYVGYMSPYLYVDGSTFNAPFSTIDIAASVDIPAPAAAAPGYLFAVATDAAGNTSEPGPCRTFVR